MADPARQPEALKKTYPVTWEAGEGEDWPRILEAARVWGEREHVDFTPADIIRSGTRRFVDELLGSKDQQLPAKAS